MKRIAPCLIFLHNKEMGDTVSTLKDLASDEERGRDNSNSRKQIQPKHALVCVCFFFTL